MWLDWVDIFSMFRDGIIADGLKFSERRRITELRYVIMRESDAATTCLTSVTLLSRMKDEQDQAAWDQFLKRYGPRVLQWCRAKGLNETDAEEVAQQVLVKLLSKMVAFEYEPRKGRFRGWLRTVTVNTWRDYLRDNSRHRNHFSQFPEEELAETVTEEYDRELFEIAREHVRRNVEPKTWRAFELRAFEQVPSRQVADELGMTVAAVNMAKLRVQRMLTDAVQRFEDAQAGS